MELIILSLLISLFSSYLIFPLNIEHKAIVKEDNHTETIKKLQYSKLFITISIGSENINIKASITQVNTEFYIGGKNILNSKYNELNSKSYNCTNINKINISFGKYIKGILSSDNLNIKNDKNEIMKIKTDFILGLESRYNNDNIEGEVGLHLPYFESLGEYNFIHSLKRNNGINSYYWFFDLENSNMIVDAFPHDIYNGIYNKDNISTINALNNKYYYIWGIIFSNIYYDEPFMSLANNNLLETRFNFELRTISAPMEVINILEQNYFSKYINDKICFKETFGIHKEIFFYCKKNDKNFNIKDFRSIYFKSNNLEIAFELDYNDLFFEKDNYIYFLITFKMDKIWNLGEIFLKKYFIVFNQDLKTMSYYQGMEKEKIKKEGIKYKINFIHILLVMILFAIIFFGTIIYFKKGKYRKNRANELLDDNYEYEHDNSNNKIKEYSKDEKFIELVNKKNNFI